jgi:hypothetical protein
MLTGPPPKFHGTWDILSAGSNPVSPTKEIWIELRKCCWLNEPHRPRRQAVSNTQTAAADISTAVQ